MGKKVFRKPEELWRRLYRFSMIRWIRNPQTQLSQIRPFLRYSRFDLSFLLGGKRLMPLFLGKISRAELDPFHRQVPPPSRSNSVAIVVTFSPTDRMFENIRKLSKAFNQVILIDNSLQRSSIASFLSVPNLIEIQNQNQNGLAGALNQGLSWVNQHCPPSWLFFFDQDTTISDHFLEQISKTIRGDPDLSNTIYGNEYDQCRFEKAHDQLEEVRSVITSGSFLRTENLARLGAYVNEMFIDSLDHEYCLRAHRLGMKVKRINLLLMDHALGSSIEVTFLKKKIRSENHSAFRWYYFIRNLIFVGKIGFPDTLPWFFSYGFSLFKYFVKSMTIEKNRMKKLMGVAQGIWDGIRS